MPAAQRRKFPCVGKPRTDRGEANPRLPASVGSHTFGDNMLLTLAYICIIIGVILIILGALGVTAGLTPYGTHGGVTLLVVGVILYVVLLLLPAAPA